MFKYNAAMIAMLLASPGPVHAGEEVLYMSVLSSHKHRIGAGDNPLVGLFISTDRGATWEHKGWREYIRTFYVEAGSDGTLWSACGNGVLRSTDTGTTWVVTTGWNVTEVLKVKADARNPDVVYAATAYGVIKSTDRGTLWEKKVNGFHWKFTSDLCIDRQKSGRVLAATEEGVYRTTNGGEGWSRSGLEGKSVRVIVQDPRDARTFWAGTEEDGVFRTTDSGSSWSQRSSGLNHRTVYAIAIDPSSEGTMYLGTHGGGVYRSKSGGRQWEQQSEGLKTLDVHSLVILPSSPRIVFAGTLNGGLYRSIDGGTSWLFSSQDEAQVWGLSVHGTL